MTTKREKAAKIAAESARKARLKVEELAALQKEEAAVKLAAEAAAELREAEAAAAEVEAEAQRFIEREEALKKENPSLWEQFKKWL